MPAGTCPKSNGPPQRRAVTGNPKAAWGVFIPSPLGQSQALLAADSLKIYQIEGDRCNKKNNILNTPPQTGFDRPIDVPTQVGILTDIGSVFCFDG